jgi:hypothetical protein
MGEQDERSAAERFPVRLRAGACYRAFGVGGRGVVELDMALRTPQGVIVARDLQPGPWSVLTSGGPVCVDTTGDYKLWVAVERGKGRYAGQLWQPRPWLSQLR